jgi:hypothetical protein
MVMNKNILLLLVFTLVFGAVNAQALLTIQDVPVKVSNAATTLYVFGDINNTGTASIDNAAPFKCRGVGTITQTIIFSVLRQEL